MSEIAGIHYISQEDISGKTDLELIEAACKGGASWVQLRVKDKSAAEVVSGAIKAKSLCDRYGARLVINDFPEVAAEVGAYGLHLGKNDMDPAEARKIVGDKMLIGGTANTLEDVERLATRPIDYIGYGPYRFTTTKKNLSPIVGLEGYRRLVAFCREKDIRIPLVAIGGILPEDLADLLATGIHGVAISSVVNKAAEPAKAMADFIEHFQMIQDSLSKEI